MTIWSVFESNIDYSFEIDISTFEIGFQCPKLRLEPWANTRKRHLYLSWISCARICWPSFELSIHFCKMFEKCDLEIPTFYFREIISYRPLHSINALAGTCFSSFASRMVCNAWFYSRLVKLSVSKSQCRILIWDCGWLDHDAPKVSKWDACWFVCLRMLFGRSERIIVPSRVFRRGAKVVSVKFDTTVH